MIFVDFERRNEAIWISLIYHVLRKDSRAIYGASQYFQKNIFETIVFVRCRPSVAAHTLIWRHVVQPGVEREPVTLFSRFLRSLVDLRKGFDQNLAIIA